jgi:hypothetical protein
LERAGLLRSGCGSIDRDDVGIDVTYRAVAGLNPGEDKAIDEDGEALAARNGRQNIGSFPGLSEDLSGFWMVGAINVADVVGPSSRSSKETPAQQKKQSVKEHCPLLGPGHAEPY